MQHRVVVTGCGGLTALGHDWPTIRKALKAGRSGVRYMSEWDDIQSMNTRLAAPVADFELPEHYSRKRCRSMGPVAKMSTRATELALIDAGLLDDPVLTGGACGIAYGACAGSARDVVAFGLLGAERNIRHINAGSYVRMMSHTGAVNISLFFGITGRVIPSASACTSGSQAIGFACEAIQTGRQKVMLAGGGEELSIGTTGAFDRLFATSTRNDDSGTSPRPFDRDRDGLVIGEGAATLVLEDLEHARERGATILAEVVGFATNADGAHVTQPNEETISRVMRMALADAGLEAGDIGYISAHATATDRGDVVEARATREVFGDGVPISSLKGHFGHSLGACGSLEAWLGICMMHDGWFAPTLNLEHVDPDCAGLDHITGAGRTLDVDCFMSNNFAFGGINTSLILRRWSGT